MFEFLRAGINNTKVNNSEINCIGKEDLTKLYKISNKHDVAHIIANVLFNEHLLPKGEIADVYRKALMLSLMRYEKICHELDRICNLFENNQISHIPLKGSVIRKYYREQWMRTSCDIDILVKKEQLELAAELITKELNYTIDSKGSYDWGFFTQGGLHIELHYQLKSELSDKKNLPIDYLADVWRYVVPVNGKNFQFKMTDELLYFYHIQHMAKHFRDGGCGIRPFIDIWVLNNNLHPDKNAISEMMINGGLSSFENAARRLSEVWFGNESYDDLTILMEEYILSGGVYGSIENKVTMHQTQMGSKIKYALSKILPPYDVIKYHYPILVEHKWLLPICQVRRWFKLLFLGGVKRSVNELTINNNIITEEIQKSNILINELEL